MWFCRKLVAALLFPLLLLCGPVWADVSASGDASVEPLSAGSVQASRLLMATIAGPDFDEIEAAYSGWLGYEVVERGHIPRALALSWDAPAMAGRPYIVMRPESAEDVYIRAVEISPVPGYQAMTSLGWNAFEIIVDDIDMLAARLATSPFHILGKPRSLGGSLASVYAMQVLGPAGEVLYFNSVKGDRSASRLPVPGSQVGRLNIGILGAADAVTTRDFYIQVVGMGAAGSYRMPVTMISAANKLPASTLFDLLMVSAAQPGNLIEIDAYPSVAGPRQVSAGELPPGNAMLSLEVVSAGGLPGAITVPVLPYEGARAVTLTGPSGELIELIVANPAR